MSKINIAKELLNEKFLQSMEYFSFLMNAPVTYSLFKVLNRRGSAVGDVPGVEIRLPFKMLFHKDEILRLADFYNMTLSNESDEEEFHTMRFQDNKQIKYFAII